MFTSSVSINGDLKLIITIFGVGFTTGFSPSRLSYLSGAAYTNGAGVKVGVDGAFRLGGLTGVGIATEILVSEAIPVIIRGIPQ